MDRTGLVEQARRVLCRYTDEARVAGLTVEALDTALHYVRFTPAVPTINAEAWWIVERVADEWKVRSGPIVRGL